MSKKIIILLFLAMIIGFAGYYISLTTFTTYFEEENRIKDDILMQNLTEKYIVEVSLGNKSELLSKIAEELGNPSMFNIEAVFIERKGAAEFLISKFRNADNETILMPFIKNITAGAYKNGTFTFAVKDKFTVIYNNFQRDTIAGPINGDSSVSYTIGVVKNNKYATQKIHTFSLNIALLLFFSIVGIAILFQIVTEQSVKMDKETLSQTIDDIVNNKTTKITIDNPYKEEIIKIINIVLENTELQKKVNKVTEKQSLFEKQNRDLIVKIDTVQRELRELDSDKIKLEHRLAEVLNIFHNYSMQSRDRLWTINQLIEKIISSGLIPVFSMFSNNSALERDIKELIIFTDEIKEIGKSADTAQAITVQMPLKLKELFSEEEINRIQMKLDETSKSASRTEKLLKEYSKRFEMVVEIGRDLKNEALKNRLVMSQNYKSFMEKISLLRIKLDTRESITIEDIDNLHKSYRLNLGCFKEFIDLVTKHSSSQNISKLEISTGNMMLKQHVDELTGELLILRQQTLERQTVLMAMVEKNISLLRFLIEMYYKYMEGFNSANLINFVNENKRSLTNLHHIQEWINTVSTITAEIQNLSEEIGREIY